MYSEQELYTYIGKQIKQARCTAFKHKKISQADLGKAALCTFQQIQKYEKASNNISIVKLGKIAQYTKKPLSYFIPDEVMNITISG